VLRCTDLVRAFPGPRGAIIKALSGLDLDEGPGCVAVVGANGAGKSTLLRLAAGLIVPDRGSVRILGADPTLAETRRHLALVSPGMRLPPRLTPREILVFTARAWGLDPLPAVAAAVERFQLGRFLDRPAGGLSTGEHQRTELARALLPEPRVLLVDEPSTGLDLPSARTMRALLAAARGDDRLVVLASHDPLEILAVADRVVALRGGVAAWRGPVAELGDPAAAASRLAELVGDRS
jgi:ABC-type multidrug transport system ATPase subunit